MFSSLARPPKKQILHIDRASAQQSRSFLGPIGPLEEPLSVVSKSPMLKIIQSIVLLKG